LVRTVYRKIAASGTSFRALRDGSTLAQGVLAIGEIAYRHSMIPTPTPHRLSRDAFICDGYMNRWGRADRWSRATTAWAVPRGELLDLLPVRNW